MPIYLKYDPDTLPPGKHCLGFVMGIPDSSFGAKIVMVMYKTFDLRIRFLNNVSSPGE